jgi:predicted DNA-binding protein YlxM (UPF0122 family)
MNDESTLEEQTRSEVEKSDQFAETLQALEQVIERHANQLEELKNDLSNRRQMLRDYFANDQTLNEVKEESDQLKKQVKERKSQLENEPQAKELKLKISELKKRRKEIQESLSNHLINHYRLTDSSSFDTSDGNQWEYSIKARVKAKPKS